jgi:hypothetical protein
MAAPISRPTPVPGQHSSDKRAVLSWGLGVWACGENDGQMCCSARTSSDWGLAHLYAPPKRVVAELNFLSGVNNGVNEQCERGAGRKRGDDRRSQSNKWRKQSEDPTAMYYHWLLVARRVAVWTRSTVILCARARTHTQSHSRFCPADILDVEHLGSGDKKQTTESKAGKAKSVFGTWAPILLILKNHIFWI